MFKQKISIVFFLVYCTAIQLEGQRISPPVPVEVFLGNHTVYSQLVFKKPFTPRSRFSFFGLASYTANYENEPEDNSLVMISQVSYHIGKGFGIMAGSDMNSAQGFSPIAGPQHNFSSKQFLAVTVLSFFLNKDRNVKLFGLYEFKPPVSAKWSLYSRLQFIYNKSLENGAHNRSYLYLRSGLKKNSLIFGLAANLDQYGPKKFYKDNYGIFTRWEFN